MSTRQVSRALFCAHCGAAAQKWVPVGGSGDPAWKPVWLNGCGHVGAPIRMGRKRADAIAAAYVAARDARLARARSPIATCDGTESVGP